MFILVPLADLVLLIKVGTSIGALNTILIVVLTALVGAYLVRREGMRVLHRIGADVRRGVFPAEELVDGAMILVAGALLLTPGFITDVVGILFIVPGTRHIFKRWIKRAIKKRISFLHFEP